MKNGMMHKLLALAMVSAMSVSLLAGCGSKGGDKKAASDVKLTEKGTYPIVEGDKPLEMTMFTLSMPNVEDLATNDFTKFMEEKTNIKWNFVTGGRDDWQDKLTLLLQADDYPDMIFGISPDLAKYGVDEQIIVPIDEYINEETMPNYMKMIKDNGFDLDLTRETDGKIYSLAEVNACYHCSYARKMWVNKHMLDEMGVAVPTTTQEFIDVCKKFKEYKPNGIAVAGAASGWFANAQDFLLGAYTFIPASSDTFKVKDYVALDTSSDKMINTAVTDEYREGLKFLKELYDMGAFYDGNFTQKEEQMKSLINQADEPVLFFPDGTISNVIDSESNNELYRHYVAMAPLKGPDGTQIAWTKPNFGFSSGGVMITDKCKNPEAALRWADFFYSEIGDLSSQYGPDEGKDWVLNPEGKKGLNGKPALYEVLNTYSPEAQNHDWQDIGIRVATDSYRLGQAIDDNVDPYEPGGLEKLLYDASKELYEPYGHNTKIQNLDELKVTSEESSKVSTPLVEINKVITENQVAFITGKKDINDDAAWQAYIKDVDNAGLPAVLEVYQTAYDRSK